MRMAVRQAAYAEKAGEVPVGALVVASDGTILARAHNESIRHHDPAGHAEIIAMRRAAAVVKNYRLDDCILVVTLEPCLMCASAMVHARIGGLVFGAADTKAGAIISCLDTLSLPFLNHSIWYMGGVLSGVCSRQLRLFFQATRRAEYCPIEKVEICK